MAACMDEPQPNFKHYCRVCKKGFMCGRALGGHMRAHGIGDENGNLDDDDTASDWDEKFGGNNVGGNNNKRMYQLRTNPNRLKSCRTCENCGKEFLSWKSFLEHGKCSSSDASESLVSSPDDSGDDGNAVRRGNGSGWSKRKRSLRSKVGCVTSNYPPSEEDDLLLARCLVQLANTTVDPPPAPEPEESCASASREEERRNPNYTYFAPAKNRTTFDQKAKGVSVASSKGLFECKACKKVFNSHQALGGHRASHKKVKGCYAAKQDQPDDINSSLLAPNDDDVMMNNEEFLPSKSISSFQFEQGHHPPLVGAARRKSKVHECSICHRVFNSGQALGGHKRCHWITSNSPDNTSSIPKFHFQENNNNINHNNNEQIQHKFKMDAVSDKLDLNVPAWAHVSGVRRDPRNPLSFEVSTDMHLQPPLMCGPHDHTKDGGPQVQLMNEDDDMINNNNNKNNESGNKAKNDIINYVDDEADSKLKLAKLSDLNDLKDMGTSGSSSKWLQVGIGSTTEATATAAADA